MSTGENLLKQIDAFIARTGMSETRFGILAVGDGHLVRRLREHKSITIRRLDQVQWFMSAHADGAGSADQKVASGPTDEGKAA